ncbi:MAG: hypothetical protein ABSB19_00335 [Methylomonas sp.]|jgi:hypothetical protein
MKVIYFAVLLLAGCASSKELILPDGKVGYDIECDGLLSGYGDCMAKAGDFCPAGYEVININGSSINDNGSSSYASPARAVSGAHTDRTIIAKCTSGK